MEQDAVPAPGWPMVAREPEFARAMAAFDGVVTGRGVALVGESGVGKSTLARGLADTLQRRGQQVRFVLGTRGGSAVPLGAFSRALTVDTAEDPAEMLAEAERALSRQPNLVLVLDDAHLLDPLSAALAYQLAVSDAVRLIVTLGAGTDPPDAVTALLKEGLLTGVHLAAFTTEQTAVLARAVLGGPVENRLVAELQRRTAGNPLLLRGLLSAGRESGVLRRVDDRWELGGPLNADHELHDLLEFRLRTLTHEERTAVEVLAVAELLDWGVLRELCDGEAVGRLERRGMIHLVADGTDTVARLNHPVIGEVAMRLAGTVRTREINGRLAHALREQLRAGSGRPRLPDARGGIRLAQYLIRSDLPPDLDVIATAAGQALTLSDLRHAEELARFAVAHGGGLGPALTLAEALSWQARGAEADEVLQAAEPGTGDGPAALNWAVLRSANLFWGCGEVDRARRALAAVPGYCGDPATADGAVAALQLAFAFFTGDVATAAMTGPARCDTAAAAPALGWAAAATVYALGLTGRFSEVAPVVAAGLQATGAGGGGPHRFLLGLAEVAAATAAGDLDAAEQAVRRYALMAAGVSEADALVEAMHGLVDQARGALPAAVEHLRACRAVLPGGSVWQLPVAAWLAQFEGARGDVAAAAEAVCRAEAANGEHLAVFRPELELGRAWEQAARGQTTAARMHATRAARAARRSGMDTLELRALHTSVRFGDRGCTPRLGQLAHALATPLAAATALHATALARHDGDALDRAASGFIATGALALAADAAAHAVTEHERNGDRAKALASMGRARLGAEVCGLASPAVSAAIRPLPLTGREREIASLAAEGLSNREMAERLSLSVRTVDGHLYRIYTKLGIEHRDQLAALLGRGPVRR